MSRVEIVRAAPVKLRRPWLAFVLVFLTLGVYYFVWYYRTNAELRTFGREVARAQELDISPGLATVAITIGVVLVLPPFISEWRYFGRIARAQELAAVDKRISPAVGFLLSLLGFFALPLEVPYAQRHLNRLWQHERGRAIDRLRRVGVSPAAL